MKEEKKVQVALKPDFEEGEDIRRIYANYFEVSHSKYDFAFTFCDTDLSALGRPEVIEKVAQGTMEMKIPIVAKIAVPTELIPEIINALQINYEKFKKKFQ